MGSVSKILLAYCLPIVYNTIIKSNLKEEFQMLNANVINNTITTWTGFRFGRPVFGFGWIIDSPTAFASRGKMEVQS